MKNSHLLLREANWVQSPGGTAGSRQILPLGHSAYRPSPSLTTRMQARVVTVTENHETFMNVLAMLEGSGSGLVTIVKDLIKLRVME